MTVRQRLRTGYAVLWLIATLLRSWYRTERRKDDIQALGQRVEQCDVCHGLNPVLMCGEHEDELRTLVDELAVGGDDR
jgi:hypothetical protein